MSRVTIEICIESIESALAAIEGGADRLELCSALSVGGLTPSTGLVERLRRASDRPIMAMVRPREGGFQYNENEIATMMRDVDALRQLGVDGVVFGALDSQQCVDVGSCTKLLDAANGLDVTFHRAFDVCRNPARALEQLIQLGFSRVLTSGQAQTAADATEGIRRLVDQAQDRIIVMPGSGVNASNVAEIVRATNANEVHGSASKWIECSAAKPGDEPRQCRRKITDSAEVRAMRLAVDSLE